MASQSPVTFSARDLELALWKRDGTEPEAGGARDEHPGANNLKGCISTSDGPHLVLTGTISL